MGIGGKDCSIESELAVASSSASHNVECDFDDLIYVLIWGLSMFTEPPLHHCSL